MLCVHAHPDDESSKGACTVARYSASGARCVLVSCTGGEAGELRAGTARGRDVGAVRSAELDAAARIIGYAEVYRLGYRDSGMDGADDAGFATVPLADVVDRLVDVFERERPDVVVTYDPVYAVGHPDHQRSWEAACAAFDAAYGSDRGLWKLYGCRTHSPAKLRAMHDWLVACGRPSPYGDALANWLTDETTTRVNVGPHLNVGRRALRAHRSQVAPSEPWFFSVPVSVLRKVHPFDDYVLLRSHVPARERPGAYEDDLFDGIGIQDA
jgi:mycothiol S-conjugate amidase